jgi:hypothetical protein
MDIGTGDIGYREIKGSGFGQRDDNPIGYGTISMIE